MLFGTHVFIGCEPGDQPELAAPGWIRVRERLDAFPHHHVDADTHGESCAMRLAADPDRVRFAEPPALARVDGIG